MNWWTKERLKHPVNTFVYWLHGVLVKHTRLPICHGCWGPCFHRGRKRRQNTAYADDRCNWVFMCDKCGEENDERWQERWDDYYSGLM